MRYLAKDGKYKTRNPYAAKIPDGSRVSPRKGKGTKYNRQDFKVFDHE